jgi:hypothetical protein
MGRIMGIKLSPHMDAVIESSRLILEYAADI